MPMIQVSKNPKEIKFVCLSALIKPLFNIFVCYLHAYFCWAISTMHFYINTHEVAEDYHSYIILLLLLLPCFLYNGIISFD